MGLITVEDCKKFRGISEDNVSHDSELERLIVAVQSFLEQECARKFEASEVTEYYSGRGNSGLLLVCKPPINSIVNIWDDPGRVWATPINTAYYALYDKDAGIIKLDHGLTFMCGLNNVKVQYNGGFSAAAMPADLKMAAIELTWAAREKGLNNLIGVRSRGVADSSVQYVNLDWPMNLGPIIDKYSIRVGLH